MEQFYFRLSNLKLESICLKKLGITIRKVSIDEVNCMLNNIFNIFNKDINKLIKLGKKFLISKNFDFSKEKDMKEFDEFNKKLESYTEQERSAILGLINLRSQTVFTRKNVENSLKQFYTLDVDETKFTKYYDLSYLKQIFLLIIDFTRFLSSEDLTSKIELNYNSLFEFDRINLENFSEYQNGIITNKFIIEYNYEQLVLLLKLLNTKNINFIMSFLTSIAFLNNSSGTIENNILNKVSLIERLIIKENSENIQEQFVLKVGAICFDGPINNEYLSDMLKSIYDIRSIIVHGNDNKFFEKIDIYAKRFAVADLSKSKYENKQLVLTSVEIFLDAILKYFFNVYINNNLFCEYIKAN